MVTNRLVKAPDGSMAVVHHYRIGHDNDPEALRRWHDKIVKLSMMYVQGTPSTAFPSATPFSSV